MKNNKNNKKTNIVIFILVMCILIVMIGFGHMDLAMSEAQGADVTMDFTPLIIVGYILCAVTIVSLIISLILGFVYGKKWKKINIAYQNKDYAFVVSNHALCDKLKANKRVDSLYLTMAISYLELGDKDEFLEYIGKIQGENTVGYKYFWMAVNAILENSAERFNFWYAKMNSAPPVEENYQRAIELIKKRLIDNITLTDEEQAFIDESHTDTIKNLFKEPVQLCLPTNNDFDNNVDFDSDDNGNFDIGNTDDFGNADGDLSTSADNVNTTIYGDVDASAIDNFDDTQTDVNIDDLSLYNDDIEE